MSAVVADFLVPLLEHTPAAHLKLLAAWDGLSVESQIVILTRFRERSQAISKDLVARRVNAHRTRGAPHGIENDGGGLGPHERFRRVLVVRGDEAPQFAAEVTHAGE